MSLGAMKVVWSSRLEPTRKLALLALADRANDSGGNCWFSMAEIAAKASISRSQAQRIVRSHVAQGLVTVTVNQAGGKPGTIPCYQLHLDRIAALADTDSTGATGGADATGRTDAHEGPHGCAGGAAPMRQTGSTGATLNIKNIKNEQATEETASPKPSIRKPSRRRTEHTFSAWLDAVKAAGEKPIPGGDPILTYADKVGIPVDFLHLAWKVFRDKHETSDKVQADWRATFRNYVKNDYLKLWRFDSRSRECALTQAGIQAAREHEFQSTPVDARFAGCI